MASIRRGLLSGAPSPRSMLVRHISASSPKIQAMKPGEPITGLNVVKNKDPPVALPRSEYPKWVDDLAKPLPTLAQLRRMPEDEAKDEEM